MKNEKVKLLLSKIKDKKNQIELIKLIQTGEITFKKRSALKNLLVGASYQDETWESKCRNIKLTFEDPGFMSFTYLYLNGEDYTDKLKYSNQICLAIQTPKNYKIDLDERYRFRFPTYEEFMNPIKRTKRTIRVLVNGIINEEIV